MCPNDEATIRSLVDQNAAQYSNLIRYLKNFNETSPNCCEWIWIAGCSSVKTLGKWDGTLHNADNVRCEDGLHGEKSNLVWMVCPMNLTFACQTCLAVSQQIFMATGKRTSEFQLLYVSERWCGSGEMKFQAHNAAERSLQNLGQDFSREVCTCHWASNW